jgi:hypothetical protein
VGTQPIDVNRAHREILSVIAGFALALTMAQIGFAHKQQSRAASSRP